MIIHHAKAVLTKSCTCFGMVVLLLSAPLSALCHAEGSGGFDEALSRALARDDETELRGLLRQELVDAGAVEKSLGILERHIPGPHDLLLCSEIARSVRETKSGDAKKRAVDAYVQLVQATLSREHSSDRRKAWLQRIVGAVFFLDSGYPLGSAVTPSYGSQKVVAVLEDAARSEDTEVAAAAVDWLASAACADLERAREIIHFLRLLLSEEHPGSAQGLGSGKKLPGDLAERVELLDSTCSDSRIPLMKEERISDDDYLDLLHSEDDALMTVAFSGRSMTRRHIALSIIGTDGYTPEQVHAIMGFARDKGNIGTSFVDCISAPIDPKLPTARELARVDSLIDEAGKELDSASACQSWRETCIRALRRVSSGQANGGLGDTLKGRIIDILMKQAEHTAPSVRSDAIRAVLSLLPRCRPELRARLTPVLQRRIDEMHEPNSPAYVTPGTPANPVEVDAIRKLGAAPEAKDQ